MLQNVGGSEWVRSRNQLCAWRCKGWHGLHESSYCYFRVYAGTRNIKYAQCEPATYPVAKMDATLEWAQGTFFNF